MAGGTREIKRKIKSVNSTMQITKAMELVSTAKLKRARDRMDITKPYFETVREAVQDVMGADKSIKTRYVASEDATYEKPLYVVITSDRGLCGGYNANAIKKALESAAAYKAPKFLVIGRKAYDVMTRMGCDVVDQFLYISEKPEYIHAVDIRKIVLGLFEKGEIDSVKFVYTRFASTISQVATELQLLPVARVDRAPKEEDVFEFVNYEPSPEAVLHFIIPKYVESTLYGGLIESSASEQAARRVAMESATDNAEDIIDELVLSFNQARQAAITQEISEIVGGAEALK
ncbi:ATP synthase F1 subunit gamma [Fusibacter sp. JL298sf-3]